MGKAEKSKKDRKKRNQSLDPVNSKTTLSNDAKVLVSNLSSVHDSLRVEACVMLCNIFSSNSTCSVAFDQFNKPEVISAIALRLHDSNNLVRYFAAGAFRNMSSCKDDNIIQSLVKFGIIRIAADIIIETSAHIIPEKIPFVEQVIGGLTNIWYQTINMHWFVDNNYMQFVIRGGSF